MLWLILYKALIEFFVVISPWKIFHVLVLEMPESTLLFLIGELMEELDDGVRHG